MQSAFYELADQLQTWLQPGEVYLAWFEGEESDFVRVSGGKVRQPGSVHQRALSLDLVRGRRHAAGELSLGADAATDRERSAALLSALRAKLDHVADDPHLHYSTEPHSTEHAGENRLPPAAELIESVLGAAAPHDLVGLYAAGPIYRGFANSLGQRNWFASYPFNLDWSLYARGDKAVKCAYAGFEWSDAEFDRQLAQASEQLAVLGKPPKTLEPGSYRAFLAPAAMSELMDLMSYGCLGIKSVRTRNTPLLRLVEEQARLHAEFSLSEETAGSPGPRFEPQGFLKPERVELIRGGCFARPLCSPRSAAEYGEAINAGSNEAPDAIELAAGALQRERALSALGTGLWINNLWYLNFSDRSAGRITGMTRFATLWVENGQIHSPVNVMRFDDTLYRMFGDQLEALTRERELLLDASTYETRSTRSAHLPGALLRDLRLTL